ncbi:hypothetical protein PV327_008742 [Microctonus hyperodae]|uniref:Uncharacterized protein n=1 Tax=Microctonus hyperodae TaxID=165561 RepID=A0AA39KV69_MICHY|nr:hypothetical protein PV327_008742 [Microctonus hyperodae]
MKTPLYSEAASNPLCEIRSAQIDKITVPPSISIITRLTPDNERKISIKRIKYKDALLTTKCPDNTVLLSNNTILQINEIYIPPHENEGSIQICGITLKIINPIFTYPCDSNDLKMWVTKKNSDDVEICLLNAVHVKMILTIDEGIEFVLIAFIEDPGQLQNIDIVPINWIYYNSKNDKLYCPFIDVCNEHNVKLLNSLVKRRSSPLRSWKSYAIDIRGTANTYNEAIKKVKKLTSQPHVFSTEDEEHAL